MVNAKVLFEYTAEQEDELSLNVGDIVKNIDCQNGGWWEGEVSGKRGMFPENFVEIISGETSADPPPVKVQEKKGKAKKAKVTFDYEAEQPDELSLSIGDIVEITLEEDDGWWEGILNGKSGAFPSNFVEVVEFDDSSGNSVKPSLPPEPTSVAPSPQHPPHIDREDSVDAAEKAKAPVEPEKPKMPGVGFGGLFSAADLQKKLRPVSVMEETTKKAPAPKLPPTKAPAPLSSPANKKPSTSDPPKTKRAAPALPPEPALPLQPTVGKERAKATFDYKAENDDELSLNVGDILFIANKSVSDGWWEGELKGKKGVFPNNFVELLSAEDSSRPATSLPPSAATKPPPSSGPKRPMLPPPGKPMTDASSTSSPTAAHEPHGGRPPPPEIKRAEHKKPSPPLPGTKPPKPSVSAKSNNAPDKPQPPFDAGSKDNPGRSMSFGMKTGPPQPPKPSGLKKPSQGSIDESIASRSASVSDVKRVTNGERKASGEIDLDAVHPADVLQNVNKSRVKGPAKNLPSKKTLPRTESVGKSDDKSTPPWMNEVQQQQKDKARSPSSSSQDGKTGSEAPHTSPPASAIDMQALEALRQQIAGFGDKMAGTEKKLLKQIKILTDDLDAERMERMKQQVEIDRLRKKIDLLEH